MMIGLHGPLGSSKTWGLVMLANYYQKLGFRVWSDTELNREYFPDYVDLNTDPNINHSYIMECATNGTPFPYERIYMLLDEWQYRADSRLSMSRDNRLFSYLYNQSRKRSILIAFSSRLMGYVDNRARDNEDIVVRCFKKHFDDKRICHDHLFCEKRHYFEWWVIDPENNLSRKERWTHPESIFPMYQTKNLETGLIAR